MTRVIRIDLTTDVKAFPEKMREIALQVIEERAEQMVADAKALCPVDTGSLQKSIRRRRTPEGVAVTAGGYITNPKTGKIVNYAAIVEQRQPFLRLAYAVAKDGLAEEIEARVADECNR